jgi:hypothetical protein
MWDGSGFRWTTSDQHDEFDQCLSGSMDCLRRRWTPVRIPVRDTLSALPSMVASNLRFAMPSRVLNQVDCVEVPAGRRSGSPRTKAQQNPNSDESVDVCAPQPPQQASDTATSVDTQPNRSCARGVVRAPAARQFGVHGQCWRCCPASSHGRLIPTLVADTASACHSGRLKCLKHHQDLA